MLSILKKTAALLLTLTITFSQCTISAAAETYDFSNQETVDMSYTDMSNTSVSDADFGNFRNVKAGRIGTFNLFRSQHPANGTSRSISANKLAKKNAISAVLNLSDSDKKLNTYFVKNKIASTYYYRTLYAKGNVHLANMKGQYNETVYRKQIVECMRFIIRKQGPYLVHCEVGRDRTGFVILLIESLMGASYTYMFKDYAQSYISRDGLTYEQARKKSIPLINEIMSRITGKPKNTGWGKLNLSYYAELYLKKGGMSPAELNTLKRNLSMNYPEGGTYYDIGFVPRDLAAPSKARTDDAVTYDRASEVSETTKNENSANDPSNNENNNNENGNSENTNGENGNNENTNGQDGNNENTNGENGNNENTNGENGNNDNGNDENTNNDSQGAG